MTFFSLITLRERLGVLELTPQEASDLRDCLAPTSLRWSEAEDCWFIHEIIRFRVRKTRK